MMDLVDCLDHLCLIIWFDCIVQTPRAVHVHVNGIVRFDHKLVVTDFPERLLSE